MPVVPSSVANARPGPRGLAMLEATLRDDLETIGLPAPHWVAERRTSLGAPVLDVLIVGAGQSGLGIAFGLRRAGVERVLVVDKRARGFAGPWRTFARMRTLRTPKEVRGPDLGIPSLSFRRWYEAQHGRAGWDALGLIPKEEWAAYLDWYRDVLRLPVRNGVSAGPLRWMPGDACFAVPLTGVEFDEIVYARKVVLATGIEGSGAWATPSVVGDSLPRDRWAHTHEAIDFEALRGSRVAILGAGAAAFDNAATALEHGAAHVRLCCRRRELTRVDAYRWADFPGFLMHHRDLADGDRYRFSAQVARMGQLPPADTFARAQSHDGFELMCDATWNRVSMEADAIRVETPRGSFVADFAIVATGLVTDLTLRPELAHIQSHIARWRDRFTPRPGEANEDLLRHPYLGANYEFQERIPGAAPHVLSVFNFTFGCVVSQGFGAAGLTGFQHSLPRLVRGVTRQLYVEDRELHYRSLVAFDVADF